MGINLVRNIHDVISKDSAKHFVHLFAYLFILLIHILDTGEVSILDFFFYIKQYELYSQILWMKI